MKQLVLDIAAAAEPTLENFIPGRNGEAVVMLYALATRAADERFVYLWGDEGSGRSHLLRAVIHEAKRRGTSAFVFDSEHVENCPADVLVVADDVDLLNEARQIALFNLYNSLRAAGGSLVAAGNAAPAQLPLRADLATRLAATLVYRLHGLDDHEKGAALRRHAEARGLRISDDVVDYLLRHAPRDMRSLLALLDALDRYSLEMKRPITLPLLRELISADAQAPLGSSRRAPDAT